MSSAPEPLSAPLVGVQHFTQLAAAREAALGLAARGLLYEIDAVGKGWVLLVEEPFAAVALAELDLLAREQRQVRPPPGELVLEPLRVGSLAGPALVLAGFFHAQGWLGQAWTDAGVADAQRMLQGEWWRAVTALTLHGDLGHLLANLATGLLFAAFLQQQLGGGVAWLLILAGGTVGNVLNAWGYRGEPHLSLGASTAVFGALGLLVAADLAARWRHPATRHKWQLIVPLGAGFSLLAYLGAGDGLDRIDYMAHGWGLLAGLALGMLWAASMPGRRLASGVQVIAGSLTVALITAAWWLATKTPHP